MSASDRECNSEGERLHNTRQRAAELKSRSDHEQSQDEDRDHGGEFGAEIRGGGADNESGRASLAAARAIDEGVEDYAEGIHSLYATGEDQTTRSAGRIDGVERADGSHTHRNTLQTGEAHEEGGDHLADRRRECPSSRSPGRSEDRDDRESQRGDGSCPTISTDAPSRQWEGIARHTDRVEKETTEKPSALQQTVQRLSEGTNIRGQTKRGRPSRRSRGFRRLSPLRLTHMGQEYSVAQPFKPRNQGQRSEQSREHERNSDEAWATRDAPLDDGMGETLFRTAHHKTDPNKRVVVEVIRQTKQEAHDRQQQGLREARRLAMEGALKEPEPDYVPSHSAQSPNARNPEGSRRTPSVTNSQEQELTDRFHAHPSQQRTAPRVQQRDESSADDETDEDVWYDTGEQQTNGALIDWDEERQEPIGDFDLAYASLPRCTWEQEMTVAMIARQGRVRKEDYHHQKDCETQSAVGRLQDAMVSTAKRSKSPRVRKEAASTRSYNGVKHEGGYPRQAGLAQGAEVKAPESFTKGLNRAIHQAKVARAKETDVSYDRETRRVNDYRDKRYWDQLRTPGAGTEKEMEQDPVQLRQLLYRMNDREDAFQDEKDRGAIRSRHPAGNSLKEERRKAEVKREHQQLNCERGEGDARRKRPDATLSNADLVWLKKAAAGSSLAKLQQRCADRATLEEPYTPAPDTYFRHEKAPPRSPPAKEEDNALTAGLIEYIEAQDKRMGQLEEQVRVSRQSSPQNRDRVDSRAGGRRFLRERVAAGRADERYASEIEHEASGRPRRSVRIKEQIGYGESSDNAYGKSVEKEIRRRHKQKPQPSETKAARRKREFLAKVAAFEAESTGEETEEELPAPAPVIQMRASGPSTKVKPPSFDGTMFLAFEQQFEAACRCSGYDEAARVELLRCSLRGDARQLLLNSGADSWTYAQLMEALRTRHGKTRSKTEVRNALREMYKKPGQKALDFADEVDFVASQAEFTPKELVIATCEAFWHGLRTTPRQQKYVEKHDTEQTLKTAAEIAARWERTKGTSEDAYIPQPQAPVDWAIIQARQTLNNGAPMTGMPRPTAPGPSQVIASAMSNEALLRQEEKEREVKRREQMASTPVGGGTLAALQATLDDLSRDHAILKNSVYQERGQRANVTRKERGGFRFGQGRGGYNGQRRDQPGQSEGQGQQQDARAPQNHQGGSNQA